MPLPKILSQGAINTKHGKVKNSNPAYSKSLQQFGSVVAVFHHKPPLKNGFRLILYKLIK